MRPEYCARLSCERDFLKLEQCRMVARNFFRRTKILSEIFDAHTHSEREEVRVSSGEDVTATMAVQRIESRVKKALRNSPVRSRKRSVPPELRFE